MPCYSANYKSINTCEATRPTNTNLSRAKSGFHKNAAEHDKYMKLLRQHCNRMGKKNEYRPKTSGKMKFNDYIQMTEGNNISSPVIPITKLKDSPTLIPKNEIDRIKEASKHFDIEERLEEYNRKEAEAKQIEHESNNRKILLKKIDDEKERIKGNREKDRGFKKVTDFDEMEKLKILDRAFIFKQEQEEEVKKANRIILNAKCSVVREAQMHEKVEINKELKTEEIKLENEMLDIDKKRVEEDEKKVDQIKINKHKYAEEIKKQLELKESIRYLEVQRMQEESKIQSIAFGKLMRDEQIEKKIKKEKRDVLRQDLDKVRETFKMFKNLKFEQEKNDEMKVRQYLSERAERARKLELERKIAKEAVDRKKQKLFEIQQKLLITKSNQDEVTLRRNQENKERQFRQKEKEKVMKRIEFEKNFAKSREAQINEKKQREALAMARNEEDFKSTVQRLKLEEANIKQVEQERHKMKEKYREEIIQQMKQREIERREMAQRVKNDYMAWKEKEDERERNIKMIIESKIKALKESDLPSKYIKDVERQLTNALRSH